MYDELLRIKQYREQTAAQAVRCQQSLLEQQAQVLDQTREDATRFHDQRLRDEQRLFEEIRNRTVKLRDIEDFNHRTAALREQEALLESRVLAEEKRLTDAQQALDAARQRYLATVREREKFDQFVDIQRVAAARESMMREENELEEVASASYQVRRGAES
jgi:hypothetical protein